MRNLAFQLQTTGVSSASSVPFPLMSLLYHGNFKFARYSKIDAMAMALITMQSAAAAKTSI